MSSFTKPLIVKVLDNGDKYELIESFEYYLETDKKVIITVPKGYVTDFASVPRPFWSIFPPFGKYSKSAVLHDYMCDKHIEGTKWSDITISSNNNYIKRKEVDDLFLESMLATGVGRATSFTLWFFVRLYSVTKYGIDA